MKRTLSQDDPRWANQVMWEKVTIENEGCLLTSLSMILALLDKKNTKLSRPDMLNDYAQKTEYYSEAQLYADICLDASNGRVQLLAKEEYLASEEGWIPHFASDSYLLKLYRVLPPELRENYAVMVKIGVHDDTFASHYLLVHPDEPGDSDDNDFMVLDPAQPHGCKVTNWMLSNSYKQISKDLKIKDELNMCNIHVLQISGVWLFGGRNHKKDGNKNSMLECFLKASQGI